MIRYAATSTLLIWLNDRELLLWRRAVLSLTILAPPMLARLLIGSPETVLSALRVLSVVDDCSPMPRKYVMNMAE
jgi:hypothetical protein